MASKAIYEADAKSLIYKFCKSESLSRNDLLRVSKGTAIDDAVQENEWLSKKV